MLRFKLDKDAVSYQEIQAVEKYKLFNCVFPIVNPSYEQYVSDFNIFIENVPYIKKNV